MATILCTGYNLHWNEEDFGRASANKSRNCRMYRCKWCVSEYGRQYHEPSLRGRSGQKKPWHSPRYRGPIDDREDFRQSPPTFRGRHPRKRKTAKKAQALKRAA